MLVSLMGLKLAGLPTYDASGFATAIAVVAVATAALTLVPALCGLAGRLLLPRGVRQGRQRTKTPWTARWATRVTRRPLAWTLAAVVILLTLAAPALGMRTWPQDSSASSKDLTTRKAHDLVADEFGPGANGPIMVVTQAGAETATTGGVEITGTTPLFSDVADLLATRLWLVVGCVVGVSVLLLGMVFRSVVVPLKAALMNLLSIGAAYGVLTAASPRPAG